MKQFPIKRPFRREFPMINERLRFPEVRVISETGEMLGLMSSYDALKIARERGYDLVLVSGKSQSTPVVKIMDYGKYRFEIEKKEKEKKKKQHSSSVKEIKMRYRIDKHDYLVNVRKAERFLTHGDKVKATVSHFGREMEHHDLGLELLNRFVTDVAQWGIPEKSPKMEGRNALVIIIPQPHRK